MRKERRSIFRELLRQVGESLCAAVDELDGLDADEERDESLSRPCAPGTCSMPDCGRADRTPEEQAAFEAAIPGYLERCGVGPLPEPAGSDRVRFEVAYPTGTVITGGSHTASAVEAAEAIAHRDVKPGNCPGLDETGCAHEAAEYPEWFVASRPDLDGVAKWRKLCLFCVESAANSSQLIAMRRSFRAPSEVVRCSTCSSGRTIVAGRLLGDPPALLFRCDRCPDPWSGSHEIGRERLDGGLEPPAGDLSRRDTCKNCGKGREYHDAGGACGLMDPRDDLDVMPPIKPAAPTHPGFQVRVPVDGTPIREETAAVRAITIPISEESLDQNEQRQAERAADYRAWQAREPEPEGKVVIGRCRMCRRSKIGTVEGEICPDCQPHVELDAEKECGVMVLPCGHGWKGTIPDGLCPVCRAPAEPLEIWTDDEAARRHARALAQEGREILELADPLLGAEVADKAPR